MSRSTLCACLLTLAVLAPAAARAEAEKAAAAEARPALSVNEVVVRYIAQEQFPGYTLRLVSGIETHNGNVRIHSVTGFVDAAPARAAKP